MKPSEYGEFSVFNSWLSIAMIVVGLSLTGGIHTQGLIKFDDDKDAFTSSLQGLSTSLVFIWIIISLTFHSFICKILSLSFLQLIELLILVWTAYLFNFWANEKRVNYSYKTLIGLVAFASILEPTLEIISVIFCADKVNARITSWVFADVIVYSWIFIYIQKKGKVYYSKKYWRYAIRFCLPLVPHYLSTVILNSSDRIMIERYVGKSEAGIYNLAYSVSLIMFLFNIAFMQSTAPWMYKKIKQKKENDISIIGYISLILIALLNLMLILVAPEVIKIFAPKEYYAAIWIVPPVAMSVYYMYFYDLFSKFAFYYEKTKVVFIASVSGAVLNILLNYIFIRQYGYIAAGYTTLVCYIVYSIAHYILMKKICNSNCEGRCPYNLKVVFLISIIFTICGFLILVLYNKTLLRYALIFVFVAALIVCRKKLGELFIRFKSLNAQ